ncbi:class I SAM-dependent methyltransferase [Candidatus Falkowbacteria bacterium]|nr:class I SAM-dependent methyltransferase [Candidatus Falkowbacteria bacterium]
MIKKTKKAAKYILMESSAIGHGMFGKLRCPVCGGKIVKYARFPEWYLDMYSRHRFIHPLFAYETFNAIDFMCPLCHASDSARLYALYLGKRLPELSGEIRLLDIAPSAPLAKLIKKHENVNYRSADLTRTDVDDQVDLTAMPVYADNSFDLIICTHVLEHIEDDRAAMSELYRIMKSGGEAILQVPVLPTLEKDYENPSVRSLEDHWRYYGEADHVRVYSKVGYLEKLQASGFKVRQLGADFFGKETFENNRITPGSVLYIVTK